MRDAADSKMPAGICETDLLDLIADARPEQQTAIRSQKRLTVISAGAGTGKTHTLARRFAWMLAVDPTCRVDRILTLTFTQLAASEMRERIRRTLIDWYERGRLPHLRDAIERMDEAYISTIHAFAMRVIRESGLDLGIDPAASMAGEPMEREFWHEYEWQLKTLGDDRIARPLSEDWKKNAAALIRGDAFIPFMNYISPARLVQLGKSAGDVFGSMNLAPQDLPRLRAEMEAHAVRRITAMLAPMWAETWDTWQDGVLPAVRGELEGDRTKFGECLRAFGERWRDAVRDPQAERAFCVDLFGNVLVPLPPSGKLKEAVGDVLGMTLAEWRNDKRKHDAALSATLAAGTAYSWGEARLRELLTASAALGWQAWDAARGAASAMSFSDLVRYAGRILRGNAAYAQRFRHVMIDEFQDTDGLQDEMLSSLTAAWGPADEVTRTLFVVGDIKQSIYRFRHANPLLFAGYIQRASHAEDALHIPLSCSYRMSGRMMDAVNLLFGNIWENGVIAAQPDAPKVAYEPLQKPEDAHFWRERNGAEAPRQPLEILLCRPPLPESTAGDDGQPRGENRMRREELRAHLADGIAARLHRMTAGAEKIWDKTLQAFRPASWRDIAVLVPTRTQYPALEAAFEKAAIPVVFGRSTEYMNRGEVRDLVNLLQLLDRPDDEYALACWIESPFSGVSPETALHLLRLSAERQSSLGALFAGNHPAERRRIEAWRRTARLFGPSAALLSLLENPFWLSAYRAEERPRVIANIRRGVDIVREYEASLGNSLSDCADYLGRTARSGARVEEPDLFAEGLDAVRVMTAHASKGLEFPVVVLMGMESDAKRKPKERAAVSRHIGVTTAAKIPDISAEGVVSDEMLGSVAATWHAFLEEQEETEEGERLFYVAATRAQERLICAGIAPPEGGELPENTWLSALLGANERHGNPFPVAYAETPLQAVPAASRPKPVAPQVAREDAKTAALAPDDACLSKISASAYALFSWCPHAYRMRYRQGRTLKWEMPDGDGYGGADAGSLAHWLLTRWDMDPATLGDRLPLQPKGSASFERALRAVPPYLRAAYSLEANRRILGEWLRSFVQSEEGRRIRHLKERRKLEQEKAFALPLGGTNLVGSIDLYWEDEDGAHLRDWKITPAETAPPVLYLEQIRFYALAVRLARPELPIEAGLIYLRPETGRPAGFKECFVVDDWAALADAVLNAAETAVRGPFEKRLRHCPICPFRRFCHCTP